MAKKIDYDIDLDRIDVSKDITPNMASIEESLRKLQDIVVDLKESNIKKLPEEDGADGQVLTTDGVDTFYWSDPYAGSTGATGATGAVGATGSTGATGATGAAGADAQGIPSGGAENTSLRKIDATDYNTEWAELPIKTYWQKKALTSSYSAAGIINDLSFALTDSGNYRVSWHLKLIIAPTVGGHDIDVQINEGDPVDNYIVSQTFSENASISSSYNIVSAGTFVYDFQDSGDLNIKIIENTGTCSIGGAADGVFSWVVVEQLPNHREEDDRWDDMS